MSASIEIWIYGAILISPFISFILKKWLKAYRAMMKERRENKQEGLSARRIYHNPERS